MRIAWLLVAMAACEATAPSDHPAGGSARRPVESTAPPNVPASSRRAAIALGSATPVAVVEIGSHGELAIAPAGSNWDNVLPAHAEPVPDLAAVEARVIHLAKHGGDIEDSAAARWSERETSPDYRYLRDVVGEPQQEEHFRIPRTYFGHFPSGLARDRPERAGKWFGQPGRADVARAEDVDRGPPLAPWSAAAPDAPAVAIARVAAALGGAIAVRVDDRLGVLRGGYRFALGSAGHGERDVETRWDEVLVTPHGVDVIAFGARRVTPIAWNALASLPQALSPAPTVIDVLVADGATAQQLVDAIGALDGREIDLGVAPAGAADGKARLDHLLAQRHAALAAERIDDVDVELDGTISPELRTIVEGARDRLGACYDARRPHMTEPEGFVGFVFELDGAGHVSQFRFDADDAELAKCMGAIVRGLSYGPAKGHVSGAFKLTSPDAH
jgi:hypothetical protein